MPDVRLSLKVDGEYLAYAAMKHALEIISDMGDDWTKDKHDAVREAELALDLEDRLAHGA